MTDTDDEEYYGPFVIVYLFAAVYGFLAISAAVLCKLGVVG